MILAWASPFKYVIISMLKFIATAYYYYLNEAGYDAGYD